jgi:hypothetical protein
MKKLFPDKASLNKLDKEGNEGNEVRRSLEPLQQPERVPLIAREWPGYAGRHDTSSPGMLH